MKKWRAPIINVIVIAGISAWLMLNLRAKAKYEKARSELTPHVLSAVLMDAKSIAFATQVRDSWIQRHSEVGGPHTSALETLGLRPTVSNLVHVFTYRMPAYSFLSLNQNRTATHMGLVQSTLIPGATDNAIHVSGDGRMALVRIGTSMVNFFQDEEAGLREASYYLEPKSTESTPSGDAP